MPSQIINTDILVIGSGPGGAVTAALLAEAGRDVVLAEEGKAHPVGVPPSYSIEEMEAKYRNGGLTVSANNPKVTYIEGCCVGGASEINAGLYHKPLPQTLDQWARDYAIEDFSAAMMEPFFADNEAQMTISAFPGQLMPAARLIQQGAQRLGWASGEVPRMYDYNQRQRQSMSQVMIPRILKAKGKLVSQARIHRLERKGNRCIAAVGKNLRITFNHVFVCAGAVQTPLLLRRSGITRNVGNALQMHPAVRVIACFKDKVNDAQEGVPVIQVSEFKPDITLGGSYAGRPHLALWLAGRSDFKEQIKRAEHMIMIYALVRVMAKGKVRPIPLLDEPWVSLPMDKEDQQRLQTGLNRLEDLAQAAGAVDIIKSPRMDLSTIHLFCSCPMGEVHESAVNSFGKVHGFDNIYINDASILPASPGVNPQATIMAIARRNVQHFIKT